MTDSIILTPVDFNPFDEPRGKETVATTEAQREILTNIFLGGVAANCAYNESVSLLFKGAFQSHAFHKAAAMLLSRHDGLRANFSADGTVMELAASLDPAITEVDFSNLNEKEKSNAVSSFLKTETETPFDILHGPLIRFAILKLNDDQHQVVLSMHHLVGDGWSLGLCMIDLGKFYTAQIKGSTPAVVPADPWKDFAVEEAAFMQSAEAAANENYWLSKFASLPEFELPPDKPRPSLRTFNAKRIDVPLKNELVEKLKQTGSRYGCTLVNTMLAAFEVFLHRITQKSDMVIALPAAGQPVAGHPDLVGHCVNLLPLRTTIDSHQSFSKYLSDRKKTLLDDFEHQRYTFGSLVRKLNIPRDPSRIPLVPVSFNIDLGITSGVDFDGLKMEFSTNPRSSENFELFINCAGSGNSMIIECTFNTDLFDEELMRNRMHEFSTLLESICINPEQKIAFLDLLPQQELNQIILEWNNRFIDFDSSVLIHELFEERAAKHPGRTAIYFNGLTISYGELNILSNRLAHNLRKEGVTAETLVGICMERSPALIISLLAVLKAGGAYVPMDPSYPADRIAFILEDARAPLLLTTENSRKNIPKGQYKLLVVDDKVSAFQTEPAENLTAANTSSNLAYIIYTSGSTGKPKGVAIEHKAALGLFAWARSVYSEKEIDGVLASTSVCFDLSVFEIFFSLTSGGRIVLVNNALDLPSLSPEANVQLVNTVPSAINELLKIKNGIPSSVKIINLAGEPLPVSLVNKIYDQTSVRDVFDLYGPSEDTTYSTFTRREKDGPYTIGKILPNSQLYILDTNLQPLPIGVAGEIFIGGDKLARGYLYREELTREKFIPNPFSIEAGAKLYRTGDLGKFRKDGNIEFLGRIDHQVKIRGFRIELGEIETVIRKHPFVFETVLSVFETADGDKKLAAYLVLKQKTDDADTILRSYLKEHVPEFMIPSAFVFMDQLPMTPNGKVDRKKLPPPEFTSKEKQHTVSLLQLSSTEEKLTDIWKDVLKARSISIHDNFFEAGGHSLLGVCLFIEIEKQLGVKLNLQTLFKAPTISELARIIDREESSITWQPMVALQPYGSRPPLFCIHMHNGNIYRWKTLNKYLPPDQPVYAIQPRGLDEKQQPHRTIPEMAAFYIDIIRTVQPHGPYRLAGLCFGGMVVFEMALQLQKAGEQVALACMVNNYAPLENPVYYRMRKEFEGFMEMNLSEKINYTIRKNINVGRKIKNKALSLIGKTPEIPREIKTETEDIRFIHGVALLNYQPAGIYHGDLFIIRTGGPVEDPQFYDEWLGWKRLADGTVEVVQVEGSNNDTIIEEEQYNKQLAGFIRDKLEELLQKNPTEA